MVSIYLHRRQNLLHHTPTQGEISLIQRKDYTYMEGGVGKQDNSQCISSWHHLQCLVWGRLRKLWAADLCAQISEEEYQSCDPNLEKQKPMIKLITSAKDIDSFISICQIQGRMKMNESHIRRKWPLWMTSCPASWPSLMSPMIRSTHHGTNTKKILWMNTLGVSSSCRNYASRGLPLHMHLRAAELIFMFYSMLNVGFVIMTFVGATHEPPDGMIT